MEVTASNQIATRSIGLQKLILLLSVFFCAVVALAIGAGLTLYSHRAVATYIRKMSESQVNLFVANISQDILSGAFAEVHRKCGVFVKENSPAFFEVKLRDGQKICSFESASIEKSSAIGGAVYFDESRSSLAATVSLAPREIAFAEFFPAALTWGLVIATVVALVIGLVVFAVLSATFRSLMEALQRIARVTEVSIDSLSDMTFPPRKFLVRESETVISQFKKLLEKIIDQERKLSVERERAARVTIAAQVAHDIRSPLTALNVAVVSLPGVQEERLELIRNAVKRINDIANHLLRQGQRETKAPVNLMRKPVRLDQFVQNIVAEKRLQFRSRPKVEICCKIASASDFMLADDSELSRIVSNLVNNAVESYDDGGSIEVTLAHSDDGAIIAVEDRGRGIPENLVGKLGSEGASFGKDSGESGFGLGLFHARKALHSIGGSLHIKSVVNEGTKVTIKIPRTSLSVN